MERHGTLRRVENKQLTPRQTKQCHLQTNMWVTNWSNKRKFSVDCSWFTLKSTHIKSPKYLFKKFHTVPRASIYIFGQKVNVVSEFVRNAVHRSALIMKIKQ